MKSFPRREKAVRRRIRKDPGLYARRAGLSALTCIALLVVIPSPHVSAAPTQGPTSKSTRVEAAPAESGPVHFNLNFLPWRKASATRQSVEAVVAQAARQPETPRRDADRAAYLPTGGSIPLRFCPARTWPDRMTPVQEAALSIALAPDPDLAIRRDELLAQRDAGVPAVPSVMPPVAAPVTTTAASTDAAQYREPQIVARPLYYGIGEAVLTTDLVLRSLDNMPNDRGAVPGQFRPAVPEFRPLDSVPVP